MIENPEMERNLRFRIFKFIGFGCQKVALKFLIGKLHKAVPILFRCPKIRKNNMSKCIMPEYIRIRMDQRSCQYGL
ncbi:MAG TPA: hypothetical protein DCS73_08145 [Roseburia sp.]|nr:hypothetical protein [Roseburia sp.]